MSITKRTLILSSTTAVLLAGGSAGGYLLAKRGEERKIYAEIQPYLTQGAEGQYNSLSLFSKLAAGQRASAALHNLEGTDWTPKITALRPFDEEAGHEAVFRLGVGDSELLECIIEDSALEPVGSCEAFTHTLPRSSEVEDGTGPPSPRKQDVALDLHLGEPAFASSRGKGTLLLGPDSRFKVTGDVRIDSSDVRVISAGIRIPHPLSTKEESIVEVADFSPRTTLSLRSVSFYTFDATYDMPSTLAPFFDDAEKLTMVRADAAVAIDLTAAGTGYHLEGRLVLLNHEVGQGIIDFYPGQYAAIALSNVSIPTVMPQVCFNISAAALELDFEEKRLRLSGEAEVDTVDSFLCRSSEESEPGFLQRATLGLSLEMARYMLDLPQYISSYGHLVIDVDDSVYCSDLAANGRSLFHAAYMGTPQTFVMWAPKSFTTQEVSSERLFSSTWDVMSDFLTTSGWEFPEINEGQCWSGDTGPRIRSQPNLLPAWDSTEQTGSTL